MIKNLKKKKGFTLIELIVVIAILGILAAIAIPRLSGFQSNAKFKADVSSARVLATAASTFYSTNPDTNYVDGTTITTTNLLTNASFLALLPASYDFTTQFDKTQDFVVTIDANGNVGITAGTVSLYPTAPTVPPSGGDYTP